MALGGLCLNELFIQVVQDELCLEEGIIIIDDQLHTCLIFTSILRFQIQLVQVTFHLIHTSVCMDGSEVGFCVEV